MRSKWKILFLCGFVLMGLAGCSAPRGTDGKTKVDQIIASEKIEIPKSQVNTTEIGDETLKKEYGKLKDSDTITIEPTGFGATCLQIFQCPVYDPLRINIDVPFLCRLFHIKCEV